MDYRIKRYSDSDFLRVRDFLSDSYSRGGLNWRIERWNFAFSLASSMNDGLAHLKESIGIFENDDHEIISVVNSEGEMRGEVFFQLTKNNRSRELLEDMFSFAESNAYLDTEEGRVINAFIPDDDEELILIAEQRGYKNTGKKDNITSIKGNVTVNKQIPEGFGFTTGDKLGPEKKAMAHAKAFGYSDNEMYMERAKKGFALLGKMPDYRPELDVFLIAPDGEPASFASMWYDEKNRMAMLEPMGTLPQYRRMGLGGNTLYEGIRRCIELGAEKAYGGDQKFYYDIGFKVEFSYTIWMKKIIRANSGCN